MDELSRMYAERGFQTMLVGTSVTGTGFYERLGFVPSHIVPNFFTDNYAEPVLDDGVLCIDMHYLKKTCPEAGFLPPPGGHPSTAAGTSGTVFLA